MTLNTVWDDGRELERATPVDGHVDVVVVGAGITGLTTALLLSSAGRSVLVVEAHRVGAGTTGRSTAKVSVLQGTRLSRISAKHSPDVVAQYVEANREGLAWLRRFCDEHDVATQGRTASTYATTARGARRVEAEHAVASAAGLPTSLVSETALPFPTTAAVELAEQLQLDPVELLGALAREAERRGASIAEGTRVRRIRGSDPVRVETETGTVTAAAVVLATNLPMLDRGGHFARMEPARSYIVAFRGDAVPALDHMYLSADAPTRSVRDAVVDGEPYLLVGGEGHPTGRGATPYRRRLDLLREWTGVHFPGLAPQHAWSAQDYLPAHGLPLVGPVLPGAEHLLIAGGYSKWGFTNGVAAALALSSRLLGGRTDWADAMLAWSRRELAGVPRTAGLNAEVGLELARGWLTPLLPGGRGPVAEGEGAVRWDRPRLPTARSRVDGQERAVAGVCTHLGGVVRWNDAEQSWDCPLHGSRFDVDGTVLDGPATCGLRRR